jgi:hypothetical protein
MNRCCWPSSKNISKDPAGSWSKTQRENGNMNTIQAQTLTNGIEETRYKLSSKEQDFIDSVKERIDEGEDLSEAQGEWLRSLYKKATGEDAEEGSNDSED